MKDSLKGAITGAALIQDIYVVDTSSSTGAGLAGLVYSTSGLLAYYKRKGFAPVAFTLAAATLGTWTGTATTGGLIATTNLSGGYELHLPTNALVAGVPSVEWWLQGAANMNPCVGEIKLVAIDDQDAVRMGMTAFPNVAAGANGGLPLGDASGRVDLGKWLGVAPLALASQLVQAGVDLSALGTLSGQTALATAIAAISNNTSTRLVVPALMELPDTGSISFKLYLQIMDENGNMEAPDSLPTIAAMNAAGTSRSAALGTVTLISAGYYSVTYTVASTDAAEQLIFVATVVEGGATRIINSITNVVNEDITGTAALVATMYADYQQRNQPVTLPTSVPANYATSAAQVAAKTVVDAIDAKTANLPATPASQGDVTTVGAAVAALHNLSTSDLSTALADVATADAQNSAASDLSSVITALGALGITVDQVRLLAGGFTFTPPTSFPGTATAVFGSGEGAITTSLSYNSSKVLISKEEV